MLKNPVTTNEHNKGPEDARIVLVEYGDFECSYCGLAHTMMKDVLQTFRNDIRFTFRHFPLTQIHPHAEMAAETAEFAASQGKFWEMYDLLFENQNYLSMELILGLVESLKLSSDKFNEAISNRVYLSKVKEDFMGGVKSGVNGTPTFFVNGARHTGSFEDIPFVLQQLTQGR